MQYLITENIGEKCRVIATNVPKVVQRFLDHEEVIEYSDSDVAVTILEPHLIRNEQGEISPESQQWLQQLVFSYSSASSSELQQQEALSPKRERSTTSFDAASVDNFLSKINRKRGTS
jgi:hypothetical protein